jgi:toxin ParE1/3/4
VSLSVRQSDYFWADLLKRVDWYRDKAGPEIAERLVDAVESTLNQLTQTPGLGRRRFVDRAELEGLRSYRVKSPFHRLLIFYRFDSEALFAERLIHGARDLPQRLRQSPYETD